MSKAIVFLTEWDAIARIERAGVQVRGKMIYRPKVSGLKVLSAIDCLVNHHGYTVRRE